ncbi:FKBP-type peptidyl-prolyl cis-trans isomerase [Hymenobacter sp. BT770]|uniref:FKBP-type peptidyl-prolyl cis-trans isomerase n=1 Tax=Hymenobacter sp. BT770 TaxID=2886942 RepID=UPI001D10695F|nr:FKBP-type peptidyl-prolyl cis-trans isomerase [Hymenobacter sp. BT770]MCC3152585.1 FKBP-type peptidyl-prolyl cis-trans isomerase [Hymenobacter sp. BT770]MDO3414438.1 FKBP-type peptidyl-prolyl cis-trans isomerase [Hymenobacter sp. BT770]
MRKSISATALRLLFLALPATAGLMTTACKKDPEVVTQDYAAIDESIIKQYITDNKITNAQRQASGLYFVPLTTDPTAVQAVKGKNVTVLYTGQFMNGTVFDASSKNGNTPFPFVLGNGDVIKGWDEGIALMRKGEKAQLLIPSALAYGPSGKGTIPPNTVLRFQVELVDVK